MSDFGGALVEDYQALGGKLFQYLVGFRLPYAWECIERRCGYRPTGEPGVAAGGGHVAQDFAGKHLTGGRKVVINGLRAYLNRSAYSAGLAVTVAGQAVTVAVFPGQEHRLGQQRQDTSLRIGSRGPQVTQDCFGQGRLKAKCGCICRTRNRQPKIRVGHRSDHELVFLHRRGKLSVGSAPVQEISPDGDHHQRRRLVRTSGRIHRHRAQSGDELLPFCVPICAGIQGENLLELIDNKDQPHRAVAGRRRPPIGRDAGQDCLPGCQMCLAGIRGERVGDHEGVAPADGAQLRSQLGQRLLRWRHHPARPALRSLHLQPPG